MLPATMFSASKGKTMQIEKALINDRLRKILKIAYPENFAIHLFIILKQFTREICDFL